MKIETNYDYPPIPRRDFDWSAYFSDSYDGATDAGFQPSASGRTEQEAVQNLLSETLGMTDMSTYSNTHYIDENAFEAVYTNYIVKRNEWVAVFESYDLSGPLGLGKTEQQAIDNLIKSMEGY